MQREEIIGRLDDAIEAGLIYNADFDLIKNKANSAFDRSRNQFFDAHFFNGKYDMRTPDEQALYDAFPYEMRHLASKAMQAAMGRSNGTPVWMAAQIILDEWLPVIEKLAKVKALIKKGRKPSDKPRKTEARTLENTGTCGCCGMNVKMKAGRLVAHGYTVRNHYFEGECLGVGFEPIEVSDRILHHMVDRITLSIPPIKAMIEMHTEGQHPVPHPYRKPHPGWDGLVYPDEQGYDRARRGFLTGLDRRVELMERDLAETKQRIETWAPAPLPGEKTDA